MAKTEKPLPRASVKTAAKHAATKKKPVPAAKKKPVASVKTAAKKATPKKTIVTKVATISPTRAAKKPAGKKSQRI